MMMPSGAHGYCGTCTDAGTAAAPSPPGHRGPPMKQRHGMEPPSPTGRASPAPRPPPRRRDSPGHNGQKKLAIVAVDGSVQTSPGSTARPTKPHPPPMSPGGGSISSSRPPPPPPPPRRRGHPAHRDMLPSSHSKGPSIGRGRGHGSAQRSHGTNGGPSLKGSSGRKSLPSAPPSPSEPTCASSGSSSASPVPASPPAAATNRKTIIPAVPHKIDGGKKSYSPKHTTGSASAFDNGPGHVRVASNGQPHASHDQHAPSPAGSGAKEPGRDAVVSLSNTSRVNRVCRQIYNYLEEYDAKNAPSPGNKPSVGTMTKPASPQPHPSSPGMMTHTMNAPSARDPSAPGTADASGSSPTTAAGRKRIGSTDNSTTRSESKDGGSSYSNARDSSMNSSIQTHLSREDETVATSHRGGTFLREKWNGRGPSAQNGGRRNKEEGEGKSSRGVGRSRSMSGEGRRVGSQGWQGKKGDATTTSQSSRVRSGRETRPAPPNQGRGGSHGATRGRSVGRESVQGRGGSSVRSGGSRSRSVSTSRGRSVSRSDLDSSLAGLSSGLKRLSTSDLRRFSSSKDDHDDDEEEAASYGLGRRSSTGSRLGGRSSEYGASSGLTRLSASDRRRFAARDERRSSSASVGVRPRSSTDGSLSDAPTGRGRPSSQGAGGSASNDGRRSSSSNLRLRDRASTDSSVSPSLGRPPSTEAAGSASSSAVHRRPSSKESPTSPGVASSRLRRRPSKDPGTSAMAGRRRPRSASLSLRRLPSRERGCPSPLAVLRRSLSKDAVGTRSTASSSTDVSECDSSIVSAMRSYRPSPGGDGTKDGKKGGRRRSGSLSRRAAKALDALDSTGSSFQDAEHASGRDEPATSTSDDESNVAAGRDDSKASMAYDVPFDPLTGRCFHHPGVCMAVRMEEGCDEKAGLDPVDSEAALVGWKVVRTACPKCTYNY